MDKREAQIDFLLGGLDKKVGLPNREENELGNAGLEATPQEKDPLPYSEERKEFLPHLTSQPSGSGLPAEEKYPDMAAYSEPIVVKSKRPEDRDDAIPTEKRSLVIAEEEGSTEEDKSAERMQPRHQSSSSMKTSSNPTASQPTQKRSRTELDETSEHEEPPNSESATPKKVRFPVLQYPPPCFLCTAEAFRTC